MATVKPAAKRRAVSKEKRREQLIKATIKCIAKKGLSSTTMADVTQEAGLSLGIVNLHFQSKDNLLVETLSHVAGEYKAGWDIAYLDSSKSAQEKLTAMVQHDFSPRIIQRDKLAVWFAFWGETKSRPTYQKICNDHDMHAGDAMRDVCQALIREGDYKHVDVDLVATGYTALADGLWLDLLITPKDMSPQRALKICFNYLRAFFPQHFS